MLGQPLSMVMPEVIGFKLTGTAQGWGHGDRLVLTVTQMLRKKGVVGKFVEFYGPGLRPLSLADRATIGNMAPEYGATCGFFPTDDETLRYLRRTGRAKPLVELVKAYTKAQGMFRTDATPDPVFTDLASSSTSEPLSRRSPAPSARRTGCRSRTWRRQLHGRIGGANSGKPGPAGERVKVEGTELRPGARRRGDCGHYLLHQHVESQRDDCGRAFGPQGRGRAQSQAVGQDLACPGLASGGRVSAEGWTAERPRQARLQPCGLRLHHLHRQFRAAAARNLQDRQ